MRDGYKILDADCHQMEPPTLWEEYIDPNFRDRAPTRGESNGRRVMMAEGESLVSEASHCAAKIATSEPVEFSHHYTGITQIGKVRSYDNR